MVRGVLYLSLQNPNFLSFEESISLVRGVLSLVHCSSRLRSPFSRPLLVSFEESSLSSTGPRARWKDWEDYQDLSRLGRLSGLYRDIPVEERRQKILFTNRILHAMNSTKRIRFQNDEFDTYNVGIVEKLEDLNIDYENDDFEYKRALRNFANVALNDLGLLRRVAVEPHDGDFSMRYPPPQRAQPQPQQPPQPQPQPQQPPQPQVPHYRRHLAGMSSVIGCLLTESTNVNDDTVVPFQTLLAAAHGRYKDEFEENYGPLDMVAEFGNSIQGLLDQVNTLMHSIGKRDCSLYCLEEGVCFRFGPPEAAELREFEDAELRCVAELR